MSRLIQVFARRPVIGQVKTRLEASIGATAALRCYRQLLGITLETVRQNRASAQLWLHGSPCHAVFRPFQSDLEFKAQTGRHLGERMNHALSHGLRLASAVVLIGTDCPSLSSHDLDQAFEALEQGHDLVLGPATDGGYVLIGLSSRQPSLFHGVQWGTQQVLDQTLTRARRKALKVAQLPPHSDIDTATDLKHWLSSPG